MDFPDGSHVIPKKWIKTNTDGETTCFFPSVKCEKTFCKMSKNMITPDKKHWGICQIIKIAGSSGKYFKINLNYRFNFHNYNNTIFYKVIII